MTVTTFALVGQGGAAQPERPANPKPRPPSHCLWAALIARIDKVFPLSHPICGDPMRILTFIRKTLDHIEVESDALHIVPARGPPLWEGEGAQETGE